MNGCLIEEYFEKKKKRQQVLVRRDE